VGTTLEEAERILQSIELKAARRGRDFHLKG